MSRLVALDTETTGLDPAVEEVWEVATVDLDTGAERVWRIRPTPAVVRTMHPKAAEKNRYHERTAEPGWRWDGFLDTLDEVREVLAGAHIVGAVPDFDARHLTELYRRAGQDAPRWHHHLICVEAVALGFLVGWDAGGSAIRQQLGLHPDRGSALDPIVHDLPYRSDDLSRACGVEPPAGDDRHTALADAEWVARWWWHMMGGGPA